MVTSVDVVRQVRTSKRRACARRAYKRRAYKRRAYKRRAYKCRGCKRRACTGGCKMVWLELGGRLPVVCV